MAEVVIVSDKANCGNIVNIRRGPKIRDNRAPRYRVSRRQAWDEVRAAKLSPRIAKRQIRDIGTGALPTWEQQEDFLDSKSRLPKDQCIMLAKSFNQLSKKDSAKAKEFLGSALMTALYAECKEPFLDLVVMFLQNPSDELWGECIEASAKPSRIPRDIKVRVRLGDFANSPYNPIRDFARALRYLVFGASADEQRSPNDRELHAKVS